MEKNYFNKKMINVRVTDDLKRLINENYIYITGTETELTNTEFIFKAILKNQEAKEAAEYIKENQKDSSIQNARIQELDTVRAELERKLDEYEEKNEDLINELKHVNELHETQKNTIKSLLSKSDNMQETITNSELKEFDILFSLDNWQFEYLKHHTDNKEIVEFYKLFKKSAGILPLDTDQPKTNIKNLLLNHYFLRAMRGKTQPQPHTREEAKIFINNIQKRLIENE